MTHAPILAESQLDELLSRPNDAVIEAVRQLPGRILILGAGGKMGPSLTRMVARASQAAEVDRSIVAVSRFTDASTRRSLDESGIETLAGDLLDDGFLRQLPHAETVIFMTGMKFGTRGNQALTWAMNTDLPAQICRQFPDARMLAFSSGNVYGYVPVGTRGSREPDELRPVGEYANSVLGRERIFSYFSQRNCTPMALVRLNYACELRYGVLVDLARLVWRREPIDVTMSHVNVIWQGDANRQALGALADATTPPFLVNVAGSPIVSIREVAKRFAECFSCEVTFEGHEATDALLNNAQMSHQRYGPPAVSLDQMIEWIADWMRRGQPQWDRPTHFQDRAGSF